MAKTHPSYTIDTTFTAKNIATALSVYTFTAAASAKVQFIVKLTNAAGGGDYVVYLTHGWLGASNPGIVLPKTTATAAAGELILEFVTMEVNVKDTDVVNVMVKGLAGDTAVVGAVRVVADNPSVFEATDTVTTVTTLTNMPAAAPSASDNATAAAAAILVTPANKLATVAGGVASADVTQLNGATTPVDNLVLALGTGGLVEKLNSMLEAAGLDYRFTAEALTEAPTEAGSGTGTYTDTIKDPSNNPLDGARVQLSTDAAGAHRVYEAFTNALGVFIMNPDPGTYYRWIDLAGYTDRLTQGAQVTVT